MSTLSDQPLASPESWSQGVWIRSRSGPAPRSYSGQVSVSMWHVVRDLEGFGGRIRTACGFGPRDGFTWPSGGSRLEIARPMNYGTLPGSVCQRCRSIPGSPPEVEQLIEDGPDLDRLADLVAARLASSNGKDEAES